MSESEYFGFVRKLTFVSSMVDKSLGELSNTFNASRIFDTVETFHYPRTHDEIINELIPFELRYRRSERCPLT